MDWSHRCLRGWSAGVMGCLLVLPALLLSASEARSYDTLANGATVTGNNAAAGSTDVADSYGCEPSWAEIGPEYTYTFTPGANGDFMVTLSNLAVDLDVFVLDAAPGEAGGTCLAFGNYRATWSATGGQTYYIVVDGYAGAQGDYTLALASGAEGSPAIGVAPPTLERSCLEGTDCASTTLQVWNDGVNTLSYTLSDDADWMTVSPASGTSLGEPDDVAVTFSTSTLAPGAYDGTITIAATGASNTPVPVLVTLNILEAGGACTPGATLPVGTPVAGNNGGAGSTAQVARYASIPQWDESGPEYAYSFTPAQGGTYTVAITDSTADLDLFVLDGETGCLGSASLAFGDTQTTWDAIAGHTYFVVVEGYQGAQSGYTILLASGSPGESCSPVSTLAVGVADSRSNGSEGSTNAVAGYGCILAWDESGPEYAYSFTPAESGTYSVELFDLTADLDVFVLDASAGCVGAACVAYGDYVATWSATAGHTYSIVVDGFQGVVGEYSIVLSRVGPPPNSPPMLGAVGNRTVAEGQLLAFQIVGTDPEGQPLVYSAAGLPNGASIDPYVGMFTWMPGFDRAGSYPVTFSVSDGSSADSESILITVTPPAGPIFADDFANGAAPGYWRIVSGAFAASRGTFGTTSTTKNNLSVFKFQYPQALQLVTGIVQAKIKLTSSYGRGGPNGMIVFAYQDAAHYRYLKVTGTQLVIGQAGAYAGVAGGAKKKLLKAQLLNRFASYAVKVFPDGWVRVYKGSATRPALSYQFLASGAPSVVPGDVGLAATKAKTVFDNFSVWDDSRL